ncbi:hypothetical protein [Streptomyces sp. NPDC008141]|uniref:hypothetical protein n=1 Tax=Streptomyces sp. NPDC008141 TaxID=3364815 RepID=UPI0036E7774A
MAEPQSNARPRAAAGAPTSGVIHVRTRLTADFTVMANALAQRRGSAVTVGVAAYILSLPDGAPVRIDALCRHFTEGEILISRALRELEAEGYLERRRERGPGGVLRTRTFFHDVPPDDDPPPPSPRPTPPAPSRPHRLPPKAQPAPAPARTEASSLQAEAPVAVTVPDPRAVAVLAGLRTRDRRLVLSRREVDLLAPAVAQWLAHGIAQEDLTDLLITGLPDRLRARPARILAFRLRDVPLAPPPPTATPAAPPVLPWQTCDGGCERAFRAAEPGRCRDCPPDVLAPAC